MSSRLCATGGFLGGFFFALLIAAHAARGENPISAAPSPGLHWRNISPTGSAGLSAPVSGPVNRRFGALAGWLGAAWHPRPGTAFSPYVALGSEFGWVIPPGRDLSESHFEVVPSVRGGWSLPPAPTTSYGSQTFPQMEIYGLAGYRLPNHLRGPALRVGVGISFLAFARWQASCLGEGFHWGGSPLVPWAMEAVYDTDAGGVWSVRLAYKI